ncbi:MAG: hypothetical protein LBT84_07700 [Spirochaetia bacterium]|jgi:hypothetical protein|nr:hypothetical protein [Spirochaetia bacterium]
MKIIVKIICALFAVFCSSAFGQESELFDVYLSMEKQRYSDTEEVNLRVSVKNISNDTAVFYVYEDKKQNQPYTTFQPKVYDMRGKENENIIDYKKQNKYTVDIIQAMGKRAVELGSGEIFTYTVDLKSIYSMSSGDFYRVRCYFVPDFGVRHVIHGKNEITFLIDGRRDAGEQSAAPQPNRDVTPSETVLLTLEAEKRSEMNKMLKYIDIEEFIRTESNFIRAYSAAGEIERREVLEKFRQYLLRPRSDYLVAFKILEEGIDGETAYVDALAERYNVRVNESYKYRFVLKKNREARGMWLITGLEASVFKGKVQ